MKTFQTLFEEINRQEEEKDLSVDDAGLIQTVTKRLQEIVDAAKDESPEKTVEELKMAVYVFNLTFDEKKALKALESDEPVELALTVADKEDDPFVVSAVDDDGEEIPGEMVLCVHKDGDGIYAKIHVYFDDDEAEVLDDLKFNIPDEDESDEEKSKEATEEAEDSEDEDEEDKEECTCDDKENCTCGKGKKEDEPETSAGGAKVTKRGAVEVYEEMVPSTLKDVDTLLKKRKFNYLGVKKYPGEQNKWWMWKHKSGESFSIDPDKKAGGKHDWILVSPDDEVLVRGSSSLPGMSSVVTKQVVTEQAIQEETVPSFLKDVDTLLKKRKFYSVGLKRYKGEQNKWWMWKNKTGETFSVNSDKNSNGKYDWLLTDPDEEVLTKGSSFVNGLSSVVTKQVVTEQAIQEDYSGGTKYVVVHLKNNNLKADIFTHRLDAYNQGLNIVGEIIEITAKDVYETETRMRELAKLKRKKVADAKKKLAAKQEEKKVIADSKKENTPEVEDEEKKGENMPQTTTH